MSRNKKYTLDGIKDSYTAEDSELEDMTMLTL